MWQWLAIFLQQAISGLCHISIGQTSEGESDGGRQRRKEQRSHNEKLDGP
jgi:hypothetical protein